ncbi:SDR family oxidoreductase [Pseudomonas sp. RIT-PI-S]|uniref:SDR family oxidoreductase n=1 Tax=Pseudomonas sp. RIT-PI-S TaxID=3035295 RepID=UPI0021D9C046|nr:SDR family oxidoreductase [Pseudomonas sp. RIT-PI-S]
MANEKHALIIGASRGLGLGLAQRLRTEGWQVTATVRGNPPAQLEEAQIQVEPLEMNDLASQDTLAKALAGQVFDIVFINAGVMGPTGSLDAVTPEAFSSLFTTNVLSPVRLAKRLVSNLRPGTGVLAFMSSTLGTVTSPDAVEAPLYKASKAALNSMVNTFAIQLPEPRPAVLCMHPGWVKTDMGGPQADIDVATSAEGMVRQLQAYAGRAGLHFINYKGETMPW